MQKTPWFREGQADIMLNYLPLRNVLTQGIKAMVKNKGLPDSAGPCKHPHLVKFSLALALALALSLADLALSRLVSRVLSLTNAVHPEGTPGSCLGWTPAVACQSKLLYLWNFPGKNVGVSCHFLLQGIFLTQRFNPHLLHLLH